MSNGRSRIEVEISQIRLQEKSAASGWFASAHVVATDLDGRKARGWVHVEQRGPAMKITGFDEYDDIDPELLRFVVATEGESILAAVRARVAEAKLAA